MSNGSSLWIAAGMAFAAPLVMLAPAPLQAAPVTFSVDDGTSDIALGNFSGGPADVLVVNQFDAGPAGATIDEIHYVFGTPGASQPTAAVALQVVLFDDGDDDGSIDNAALLASAAHMPTQIDNDVFNVAAIAPTFVTGRFFVGLFAQAIPDDQAIVGADTNFPMGDTLSFAGTALDLDNILGTADVFSFDPDPFSTALIRAVGVTGSVPEPASLAALGLGLALLLAARRRPARTV